MWNVNDLRIYRLIQSSEGHSRGLFCDSETLRSSVCYTPALCRPLMKQSWESPCWGWGASSGETGWDITGSVVMVMTKSRKYCMFIDCIFVITCSGAAIVENNAVGNLINPLSYYCSDNKWPDKSHEHRMSMMTNIRKINELTLGTSFISISVILHFQQYITAKIFI